MKEVHKPALTANMVMVTDANGNPIASDKINNTELNMLNNIRTNVQTQIDNANAEITNVKTQLEETNTNLTTKKGYVDYSDGWNSSITYDEVGNTFTAANDCLVVFIFKGHPEDNKVRHFIYVDGQLVSNITTRADDVHTERLFLKAGQTYKYETQNNSAPYVSLSFYRWK